MDTASGAARWATSLVRASRRASAQARARCISESRIGTARHGPITLGPPAQARSRAAVLTMSHQGSTLASKGKASTAGGGVRSDVAAAVEVPSSGPRPGPPSTGQTTAEKEEARARREAEKAELAEEIATLKAEIFALEQELAKMDAAAAATRASASHSRVSARPL